MESGNKESPKGKGQMKLYKVIMTDTRVIAVPQVREARRLLGIFPRKSKYLFC